MPCMHWQVDATQQWDSFNYAVKKTKNAFSLNKLN